MPIFIAKKITLNYSKSMREKIIVLSLLLSLPLCAYGSITLNCSGNQNQCDSKPGCKYLINDCIQCADGEYCPGNGLIKTCTTEAGSDFEFSPDGSTDITDCYKKIDENNNYCEKENGEHIATCGLFYPNNTPKCWDAYTGEYDENYHIESNNKCYSNIRNCERFNKSGCDGAVSGRLKWSVDEYWTSAGTAYNCECKQTEILHNSCIADATYSLTDIAPDNDTEHATITFGTTPSYYECKKCPAGTYLTPSDFTPNPQCTGGGVACSCTNVEQGFYSTECTIKGTSSCQQTPCPKPGQTTNGAGAGESEQDCHYSSETKFCDAAGCFTISDAGGNNVWNWNY